MTTRLKQRGRCLVTINRWGDECGQDPTGVVYDALANDDILACTFHTERITRRPDASDYRPLPLDTTVLDRAIEALNRDISQGIGSHKSLTFLQALRTEASTADQASHR